MNKIPFIILNNYINQELNIFLFLMLNFYDMFDLDNTR